MMRRLPFILIFIVSFVLLKITGQAVFLILMYITGIIITIVAMKSYMNFKRNRKDS